jgi:hypothetical protein
VDEGQPSVRVRMKVDEGLWMKDNLPLGLG